MAARMSQVMHANVLAASTLHPFAEWRRPIGPTLGEVSAGPHSRALRSQSQPKTELMNADRNADYAGKHHQRSEIRIIKMEAPAPTLGHIRAL